MRLAVLADVHSNQEALEAVLGEIDRRDADRILVLGDLVGYNARPREVLRLLRARDPIVVVGNHDLEVAGAPTAPGTNDLATRASSWTAGQLDAEERRWLGTLPNRWVDPAAGFAAVHGCFLNETFFNGYVSPTMLQFNLEAIRSRGWPGIAFCGHTHVPMLGWLEGETLQERQASGVQRWPAGAAPVLINPGSVGQPRDGDCRASFALIDLEAREVEFVRVAYDVERAAAAIREAGLPEQLADRLFAGR